MAKLTTESVADILMTLKNGPCNNTELLHQYIFYEKNGSKVLNIKLVGPGLTALSAMSSPMDDIFLQETGNTLVFGDKWYGWDNVQDIQNIAKQYITDYKIEKLNIIIHTHGVIKDGIYYLGLGYDPEGTMGAPQFINSNSITKELSELSQLVAVTHIISVACYGNNQTLDESFINFKNTTFYAKLTLWKVLNRVKMENGAVVAYNHLKVLTLFGKPFYLFYLQFFLEKPKLEMHN